jgi:WD40 repeat protein
MIASAGTDLEITLFKVAGSGLQRLNRTFQGHTDVINGIHFTSSSKSLITASSDRTVRFWDTETG